MPPSRPVCPLTLAAWRLGGLSLGALWERYLGLGGCHGQTALAAYLDGTAVWPDGEHNVLSQALNENLCDLGLPSLAPHREPEEAARDAAPDTGRAAP